MKTTLGWLKTHLDTPASLDELVRRLVMLGLEVESVENRAKDLAGFVIGRVIDAKPHPNADRLKLLKVDAGKGEVEVVCGAPNARAGLVGVFAAPGITIPRNGMVLKVGEIRGVKSNGMMCSGYELKLSEDHEGIIELPSDLKPGASFAQAMGLDDPVLDVKITPNRADCLGVRGLARDLAASGLGKLKPIDTAAVVGQFESPIKVHLEGPDAKACPLFLGRLIRGVKNGPSPRWLQDRLTAIGLRPISALVDVTNFLTYDLDRPLHVFDADKLKGDLTLRGGRPGEELAALNGKRYALDESKTVIADQSGALSLGGVIGGESSACGEATTNVFIEAALFDPVRTAATGRKLQVQSDARYRFERGVDPEFTAPGLEVATRLIIEMCGGTPSKVAIAGAVPEWQRRYHLRADRVETLGGVAISAPDQRRILEDLGCKIANESDGFAVEPPSWRADIEGEADLVEEILRIRGYDEIPSVPLPRDFVLPKPALTAAQRRAVQVRRCLAARGLVEAVTFSFLPRAQAALFGGGSEAVDTAEPPRGGTAQCGSRFPQRRSVRDRAVLQGRHARGSDRDRDRTAPRQYRREALGRSRPAYRRAARQSRRAGCPQRRGCRRRKSPGHRGRARMVSSGPFGRAETGEQGVGAVRRDPSGHPRRDGRHGAGRRLRGVARCRAGAAGALKQGAAAAPTLALPAGRARFRFCRR
jgi:phenylalanyl-tRNA synthetase beta chain